MFALMGLQTAGMKFDRQALKFGTCGDQSAQPCNGLPWCATFV